MKNRPTLKAFSSSSSSSSSSSVLTRREVPPNEFSTKLRALPCIGALFHLARVDGRKEAGPKRNRGVIIPIAKFMRAFAPKYVQVGCWLIKLPEDLRQIETEERKIMSSLAGSPIRERKRERRGEERTVFLCNLSTRASFALTLQTPIPIPIPIPYFFSQ